MEPRFWHGDVIFVSIAMLILLCGDHGLLKCLMKSVKVEDELASLSRGQLMLSMDGDVWMVTLVSKNSETLAVALGVLYENSVRGKRVDQSDW